MYVFAYVRTLPCALQMDLWCRIMLPTHVCASKIKKDLRALVAAPSCWLLCLCAYGSCECVCVWGKYVFAVDMCKYANKSAFWCACVFSFNEMRKRMLKLFKFVKTFLLTPPTLLERVFSILLYNILLKVIYHTYTYNIYICIYI